MDKKRVTIKQAVESMRESQKEIMYWLVGHAIETGENYLMSDEQGGLWYRHLKRKLAELNTDQLVAVDMLIVHGIEKYRENNHVVGEGKEIDIHDRN